MDNEVYWRQAYRLQLEVCLGLCRSLMACSGEKPTVYTLAYHLKEKATAQAENHDEWFPYDLEESK